MTGTDLFCCCPSIGAVTLGPKLSETVRGKLSLGARILQAGGVERAFRREHLANSLDL